MELGTVWLQYVDDQSRAVRFDTIRVETIADGTVTHTTRRIDREEHGDTRYAVDQSRVVRRRAVRGGLIVSGTATSKAV